jgi:hypothetical protein
MDAYPCYGCGRPLAHDAKMDKLDTSMETIERYRFDICTDEKEPFGYHDGCL